MGDSDPVLTYRQLIAEVRRLCVQRQTGWLFITTSGQSQRALRAPEWNDRRAHVPQQDRDGGSRRDPAGPQGLAQLLEWAPQPQAAGRAAADPRATRATRRAPARPITRTRRTRALARSTRRWPKPPHHGVQFVEYLGPMARLLLDEHVPAASNLTHLIDSLARERATIRPNLRASRNAYANGSRPSYRATTHADLRGAPGRSRTCDPRIRSSWRP